MRGFIWVCVKIVIIGAICLVGTPVGATAWNEPLSAAEGNQREYVSWAEGSCSGVHQYIAIRNRESAVEGCVFGPTGGTQVARYQGDGGLLYAIRFPFDAAYTQIRGVCELRITCIYGQAGDVLLAQHQHQVGLVTAVIPDFTQYLTYVAHQGGYYQFEYDGEYDYLKINGQAVATNAAAVSSNGEWGVVEMRGYGIARIHFSTGERRRVVASTGQYGYGANPFYELAISNDGSMVALGGERLGFSLYRVNTTCGDQLPDILNTTFSQYVEACSRYSFDTYAAFPGLVNARMPRFSEAQPYIQFVYEDHTSAQTVFVYAASYEPAQAVDYHAYGDSFSSGEGELSDNFYITGTNTADNRCHVSVRSYPFLIAESWSERVSSYACSGGRMDDVAKSARERSTLSPPGRISVGVGGNDVGLIGKLAACLSPGTCEWAESARRSASADEIMAIQPKLSELLQQLKAQSPGAHIGLIGYPSVIDTSGEHTCGAVVTMLLTADERRYMDESIRLLNQVMRAAAAQAQARFIDVEDAMSGERLCDALPVAMNSVRLGDDIGPVALLDSIKIFGAESFHPTPRGHERVAAAITAQGSDWSTVECPNCTQVHPASYWGDTDEPQSLQRTAQLVTTDSVAAGAKINVSLPAGSFQKESPVRVEFHSEPTVLVEGVSHEDGSYSATVTIPDDVDGYHSLHVLGVSRSDKLMDYYQVVSVLSEDEGMSTRVGEPYTANALTVTEMGKQSVIRPLDSKGGPLESETADNPAVRGAHTRRAAGVVSVQPTEEYQMTWPYIVGASMMCIGAGFAGYLFWRRKQ